MSSYLTSRSKVFCEKIIDPQFVKKNYPRFMEPEACYPLLQKRTTCPYSEPDKFHSRYVIFTIVF